MEPDSESDPFGERARAPYRKTLQLVGARVHFDSDSRELLQLAESAYANLPPHRLPGGTPELRVSLRVAPVQRPRRGGGRKAAVTREPAPLTLIQGAGMIGGVTSGANLVLIAPREGAALVHVPPAMLRFGYHARYELIEFAVFALASRVRNLIPVHGACVGQRGRGILLLGPSGAGKSTLTLHCALRGFDFLSEDSVFIEPGSLRATGAANYLHLRADSLRWLGRSAQAADIRRSPVIRRRSGIRKYEIDLRHGPYRLAAAPLRITAIAFLTAQPAGQRPLLQPLSTAQCRRRFAQTQAYGASQPQWQAFNRQLPQIQAFELRRPDHPDEAVAALQSCLGHQQPGAGFAQRTRTRIP
jgi:hypothetical protein